MSWNASLKAGRASGSTEGNVSLLYGHAKLDRSPETTHGFTVVSESHHNLFIWKGIPDPA